MKLLFDQILSPKLARLLSDIFPDSTHVHLIGLDHESDPDIWDYAARNNFAIVSKDSDFADDSAAFGYPPHVVLIQAGNCATSEVEALLRSNETIIQEMISNDLTGLLALF